MKLLILGTRGIPACYGGFETFAEQLALYLVSAGHEVIVYCQDTCGGELRTDSWNGIERVHIPAPDTPVGTMQFDWDSVKHSSRTNGIVLTLGYNTAIFSFLYRLNNVPQLINMDGLEWRRAKWSKPQRAWLWLNEIAGSFLGRHLIADHPEIKAHLQRHTAAKKISIIPYGADAVEEADATEPLPFDLKGRPYFLVIARPEPENSLLEIVQAFSSRPRNSVLLVLGKYRPETFAYQKAVMDAASDDVQFVGALYDRAKVANLRFHAQAYVHGHTVGGTNPSLIESMAAGNAIIAHDNCFTRWVAGEGARFFSNPEDLNKIFTELDTATEALSAMKQTSRVRHSQEFTQELVLKTYETLLMQWAPAVKRVTVRDSFYREPIRGKQ